MHEIIGTTGLVFNEPLLWETGAPGRCGFSLPENDTGDFPIDRALTGEAPALPELGELDVVRHYTRLSQWNIGVDTAMYPLGSCTMKYNPKVNEMLAALPGFTDSHPLAPEQLMQGTLRLMHELERYLAEITGMDAVSLQPSAGAQGELTGVMMVHAYFRDRGEKRTKFIIPDTAHGTNPASVALCGFTPVKVATGGCGMVLPEDIAPLMDEDTAGIMLTNPNTIGLFEEHIREIADIVHAKGGLVYCDGANLNALMGMVKLGDIGVDIMHCNLHKTFSTPHGGGGPGSGPVCARKHLEPYLPVPRIVAGESFHRLDYGREKSIGRVHSFFGNLAVQVRAYAYILSMGPENLKLASQLAVLNANYIRVRLKDTLRIACERTCMHECVFSEETLTPHKVATLDLAKRLIDYGFHPPTVYFPLVVHGAIMIEPTETESKETIDRFIEAVQAVMKEAAENPEKLHQAPVRTKVRRMDETRAARELHLRD